MTGLKRIIFIAENELSYIYEIIILNKYSSILLILKIIYYSTYIFLFIIFLFIK